MVSAPPEFHGMDKEKILWKSLGPNTVCLPKFFKISSTEQRYFFLRWNTKEDILKYAGNLMV